MRGSCGLSCQRLPVELQGFLVFPELVQQMSFIGVHHGQVTLLGHGLVVVLEGSGSVPLDGVEPPQAVVGNGLLPGQGVGFGGGSAIRCQGFRGFALV